MIIFSYSTISKFLLLHLFMVNGFLIDKLYCLLLGQIQLSAVFTTSRLHFRHAHKKTV